MKPKKSATLITLLVLVFMVFILQACGSGPVDPYGPGGTTTYPGSTPSSSDGNQNPDTSSSSENQNQFADQICTAYDQYNDSNYNERCAEAQQAVQGMNQEQYNQYYQQQVQGEQQHEQEYTDACTYMDPYNDPDYQTKCDTAKQQAWEPASPW